MGYQRDDFAKCVGDTFRVVGESPDDWRLLGVSDLQRSGDFESYSIEFHAAHRGTQGMVTLEHADLGTIDLFVVAVAPGRYEAVFNQLVGAEP